RGLAYAAVCLVLGMLYGTLLWLAQKWHPSETSQPDILSGALFVSISGFLLIPLLVFLRKHIDRFFLRDEANRQAMMHEFARAISMNIDLSKVAGALGVLLRDGLKTDRVEIY